jgi:hypothetical protein
MLFRLLVMLIIPVALPAQLHLTARLGIADHSGHARNATDPEQPTFGPGTTRDGSFAFGLDRGAWRFSVLLRRETPDLVLVGETTGIITRNALEAWHGGVEIGRRLVGKHGASTSHLLVGAGYSRWNFPGFEDPARNRLGAWVAIEGGAPLLAHLEGVLRLEALTSASLFEASDLPDGYESLAAHRLGLSLGLRWRR